MSDEQQKLDAIQRRLMSQGSQKKRMNVRDVPIFQVTAGEIRTIVARCSEHPVSKALLQGAAGFKDNHILYVEKPDVMGILEGREVEIIEDTEADENGETYTVIRKQLGKRIDSNSPKPINNLSPMSQDSEELEESSDE